MTKKVENEWQPENVLPDSTIQNTAEEEKSDRNPPRMKTHDTFSMFERREYER